MALNVRTENLADEGKPAVESVRLETAGTTMELRPQWTEDRFTTNPASVRLESSQNLNGLLSSEVNGKPQAVAGHSEYGGSTLTISERNDIGRVAQNLNIPASDIGSISYTQNGGRVGNMNVTFREGVAPEVLQQYHNNMALALEGRGIVPPGTAFQMNAAGFANSGPIGLDMGHQPGSTQPQSLDFNRAQNGTGQNFQVRQNQDGSTDIVVGADRESEHGSMQRSVTREEEAAAQRLSAAVGGKVTGEAGVTNLGMTVHVDKPMTEVLAQLEQHKLVDAGLTEALQSHTTAAVPETPHASAPEAHAPSAGAAAETHAAVAAERGAIHETESFARRLGGKLGIFAAVAIGGYELMSGRPSQAAEIAIPGAAPVMAAIEGRPVEAAMRTAEMTGVGSVLTEIARPMARIAGMDVDPGIVEGMGGRVKLTPEEQSFFHTYDQLPTTPAPGMPPEVESLVEMKRMIETTQGRMEEAKRNQGSLTQAGSDATSSRVVLESRLEHLQEMYAEHYDGMDPAQRQTVQSYLDHNPQSQPVQAPSVVPPSQQIASTAPSAPRALAM